MVGRRLRHDLIVSTGYVWFKSQQTIVLNPRLVEGFFLGIELMRQGGVFDSSCLRNAARDLVGVALGYLASRTAASSFVVFGHGSYFEKYPALDLILSKSSSF